MAFVLSLDVLYLSFPLFGALGRKGFVIVTFYYVYLLIRLFVCVSMVPYAAFVLSLGVPHLSFLCLGKFLFRD